MGEIPWKQAGCRALAAQLDLRPSKKLGQNFLPDRPLLERIVVEAGVTAGEPVLEIGPGMGHLTEVLLEAGAELTAVELDWRLACHLRDTFGDRLTLREGDALAGKHALGEPVTDWLETRAAPGAVVANLPYSVASPLMVLLARVAPPLRTLLVLVQREVAERIDARPGTRSYGPLTIQLGYHCDAEQVLEVAPSRFWPRPKIASTLLRLTPRPREVPAVDPEGFADFVRAALGHRRKTLRSALKNAPRSGLPALPSAEELAGALEAIGHGADVRAEQLSIGELVALFNRLHG